MPATCSKCGDCCRAISVGRTKAAIRRIEGGGPRWDQDRRFILRHWHRINRAEAYRRLPGLARTRFVGPLYECDRFDSEHNLCTAHEDRPPVCRGFPFYAPTYEAGVAAKADSDMHDLVVFPRCAFWEDLRGPLLLRLLRALSALASR